MDIQNDLRIQRLYEALKSAAYYIDRLETAQRGKRVADMDEAASHYYNEAVPLIVAYENE